MRRAARLLLTTTVILSTVLCAMSVLCWQMHSSFLQYSLSGPTTWIIRTSNVILPPNDVLTLERYENSESAVNFSPGWTLSIDDAFVRNPWNLIQKRSSPAWYKQVSLHRADVGFILFKHNRRPLSSAECNCYRWRHPVTGATLKLTAFSIPLPLLAALTAIPGVLRISLSVRKRRQTSRKNRAGLCTACGYDLRATPNRCPECGKVPDKR